MTELDRLGYLVHKIDRDCAVVPSTSHKTSLTGELMSNLAYRGQTPEEIANFESYRHYRESDEETRLRIYGKLSINPS